MDYKYIEQLLDRYWRAETSLEEEQILRAFFAQKDVPAALAPYKSLFAYTGQQAAQHLGEDFDRRVLAAIDETDVAGAAPAAPKRVKTGHITLANRLRPLYRAAAAVAIVTLLGTAAQQSFVSRPAQSGGWDYNTASYKDSYDDPQRAYEAGMKALDMFKKGPKTAVADSTARTAKPAKDSGRPQPRTQD